MVGADNEDTPGQQHASNPAAAGSFGELTPPAKAGADAGGSATEGGGALLTAGTTAEGGNGNDGGEAPTGGALSAGSGGSAGAAPVSKCTDHPLTAKVMWVPTASSSSLGNGTEPDGLYNPPEHLVDGRLEERWSSGKAQDGTEWIRIDFGAVVSLTEFTLQVNNDVGDYPRHYDVRLTTAADPFFMGPVLASGDGMPGDTVISFDNVLSGRYLTVRQTAAPGETSWWTIAEVTASCSDP